MHRRFWTQQRYLVDEGSGFPSPPEGLLWTGDFAQRSSVLEAISRHLPRVPDSGDELLLAGGASLRKVGRIIQCVTGSTATQVFVSPGGVFIPTTLSATITPKLPTSNIVILVHHAGIWADGSQGMFNLQENGIDLTGFAYPVGYTATTTVIASASCGISAVRRPPAGALTYRTTVVNFGTRNFWVQVGSTTSTIVLMEIKV